jgi:hypothetical protein
LYLDTQPGARMDFVKKCNVTITET